MAVVSTESGGRAHDRGGRADSDGEGWLTTIDQFVEECGSHTSSRTNNGYGCRHPDVRARDDYTGEGQCFAFSCPFAHQVLPDSDPEDAAMLIGMGEDPTCMSDEGNWILVHGHGRRIVRLPVLGANE